MLKPRKKNLTTMLNLKVAVKQRKIDVKIQSKLCRYMGCTVLPLLKGVYCLTSFTTWSEI